MEKLFIVLTTYIVHTDTVHAVYGIRCVYTVYVYPYRVRSIKHHKVIGHSNFSKENVTKNYHNYNISH